MLRSIEQIAAKKAREERMRDELEAKEAEELRVSSKPKINAKSKQLLESKKKAANGRTVVAAGGRTVQERNESFLQNKESKIEEMAHMRREVEEAANTFKPKLDSKKQVSKIFQHHPTTNPIPITTTTPTTLTTPNPPLSRNGFFVRVEPPNSNGARRRRSGPS